MSALDFHYETVTTALIKDGWTITHDPFAMKVGRRNLFIDLGAERVVAAEKDKQKIAVEIKSLDSSSDIAALQKAIGQYMMYHAVMMRQDPERTLYLAIPEKAKKLFEEPVGQILLEDTPTRLIIFAVEQEEIVEWIK